MMALSFIAVLVVLLAVAARHGYMTRPQPYIIHVPKDVDTFLAHFCEYQRTIALLCGIPQGVWDNLKPTTQATVMQALNHFDRIIQETKELYDVSRNRDA